MNTTAAVVLTGAIVTLGQWLKDRKVTMKIWIGVAILALMLSLLSEADPKLASQFGALVLVGAFLLYMPDIANALKGAGIK
jgi:hypothetical protein